MLRKKMLRDLKENKGTYLACIVVMILGIMVFTAFSLVVDNLKISQKSFYTEQNFADGFAQVEALPFSAIGNLQNIKGIKQIEGRIVKDVQVYAPQSQENIYLRLVSMDPSKENRLNDFLLEKGTPLSNKAMNIWVDNKFFEAQNLKLNDKLEIIANGKIRELKVVGFGKSPEFIYALRTTADLYPSPETFGIAFVPIEIMEKIFVTGVYNDLVFSLEPGVDFEDIEDTLEYKLKPYGLRSLIPRKDQVSHSLLEMEITSLETMARVMPVMFLGIAAMILYITLKRLIEQQRGQIGILKAFGYTRGEILSHYLSYPLVIALSGSFIGGILGIILAGPFTSMYRLFFNMPEAPDNFSILYLILGIVLSLTFALGAGYQGCKNILKLEPAQALRPPSPPSGRRILLERIPFFWNMLTVQGMMAVRNISRNKGRSFFIFVGIMFCFAITAFTWSMNDLIQKMLFDQYEKVEVYDLKISLSQSVDAKAVSRELSSFPGVNRAEPMAEIPVTLKNKWLEKDVVILGLPPNSHLYNILDAEGNSVELPDKGILLSERLASLLNASLGTKLNVDTPLIEDWDSTKQVEVRGIIPQYVGINAYMNINALQEFLKAGPLATSFMLTTEKERVIPLKEKYRESALVASIEAKEESFKKLQELMASYGSFIYIYALIGVIIGFAIIYSSSVITVSERSRELASMMVLGMTPAEVLSVVTFEQWFLGLGAMIAGIPMSKLMLTGIAQAIESDIFSMPVVISPTSYLLALIITAISIWLAQQAAAGKIKKLSLVEVLKERE